MKAIEKYKLVENRPELTPEQVREGMDFQSVTKKISTGKNSFPKTAVLAVIISACIITGYLLYRYFITPNREPEKKAEPGTIQDTIYRSADTVEMILIDKHDSTVKNKSQGITERKKNSKAVNEVQRRDTSILRSTIVEIAQTDTVSSVSQGKMQQVDMHSDTVRVDSNKTPHQTAGSPYTCVIWKTDDPCAIPDSAEYKLTINCTGCEFVYMNCNELEKKPGKIVWLNISARRGRVIMRKHFENITLYSNGKKIHPYAVANIVGDKNNRYLSDRFKANYMAVTFQKKMILILVFPDAKVGDRIVIDETIDAVIQK